MSQLSFHDCLKYSCLDTIIVSCIPLALPGQVTWTVTVQALVVDPNWAMFVVTIKGTSPVCWADWLLAYRGFWTVVPVVTGSAGFMICSSFRSSSLWRMPAARPMKSERPAAFHDVGCMDRSARMPTAVRNSVMSTSTMVIPRLLHAVRDMGPSCNQHIDRTGGIAVIGHNNGCSRGDGAPALDRDGAHVYACHPDVAVFAEILRFIHGSQSVGRRRRNRVGIRGVGAEGDGIGPVLRQCPAARVVDIGRDRPRGSLQVRVVDPPPEGWKGDGGHDAEKDGRDAQLDQRKARMATPEPPPVRQDPGGTPSGW